MFKEKDTEDYREQDSTYVKYQNRENKSAPLEVESWLPGGVVIAKAQGELSWGVGNILFLDLGSACTSVPVL